MVSGSGACSCRRQSHPGGPSAVEIVLLRQSPEAVGSDWHTVSASLESTHQRPRVGDSESRVNAGHGPMDRSYEDDLQATHLDPSDN